MNKHPNTFRVECCANRRVIVNDVIVCIHCDLATSVPNWGKAKMPTPNVKTWHVNPVKPA